MHQLYDSTQRARVEVVKLLQNVREIIQPRPLCKSQTRRRITGLTLQHKKIVIAVLSIANFGLMSTELHQGQNQRLGQMHQLEAAMAPSMLNQEVEIHPVQAPKVVEASLVSEKVTPTPTPVPTVQPTVASAVAGVSVSRQPQVGNWDALLQAHFGEAWQQAKAIMMCESGGNTNAMGPINAQGTRPYGLMQIMYLPGRPSPEWLMVPDNNLAYAA